MRTDSAVVIRAHLIAAMEQRAAGTEGEARRVLEARLAGLRARDADASDGASDTGRSSPRPSPLRDLVDHLACAASPDRAAYPDVPALAEFRQLWSTLRADSQLRQSVDHDATDAGPLNSTALASRAITLMRALSPGYLRSFLAYVDDLAWLEALGSGSAVAHAAATRKRASRKPRT